MAVKLSPVLSFVRQRMRRSSLESLLVPFKLVSIRPRTTLKKEDEMPVQAAHSLSVLSLASKQDREFSVPVHLDLNIFLSLGLLMKDFMGIDT